MFQQHQQRPRQHAIGSGLWDLALGFVVCGAISTTFVAARLLPWTFIPVTALLMVLLVNIIYLGIYELEHYGLIDDERCKNLIESVQGWCPVVANLFAPIPPRTQPWPMHVTVAVARSIAQFLGA